MKNTNRITLVLKAPDGSTLEQVLPFAMLGAHVSIGRGLAVIAGMSEDDLQAVLEEQQAEAQPIVVDKNTVNQDANFDENVNQHQDDLEPDLVAIIAALQQKISLMEAPLDIDDHVKLVADARRYRWLRAQDSATDPVMSVTRWTQVSADRSTGAAIAGEDLDQAVDTALRLEAQGQQVAQDTQDQQP